MRGAKGRCILEIAILFGLVHGASLAHGDTVYMTPEQALHWAFPKSECIEERVIKLEPEAVREIETKTGGRIFESDKKVYVGMRGDRIDGYAVITNEIGKFEPITFIVKVTPDGKVADVAVMVYRESRGGEVERKRFLHQYLGKKEADPLRINYDIINVTGATMSVRAMSRGVKKVLHIVNHYVIGK